MKDEDDGQFLPEIDQEPGEGEIHISPALRALMDKYEGASSFLMIGPLMMCYDRVDKASASRSGFHLDGREEIACTKIYYASRTHSQLSQVLPELGRLKLQTKISVQNHHNHDSGHSLGLKRSFDESEGEAGEIVPTTRAVSLGSRKQLCINEGLRTKAHDLDEACRELLGGL